MWLNMNFGVVFFSNLFVISIIVEIVFKKLILSDFLNSKIKCYFLKDKNMVELIQSEFEIAKFTGFFGERVGNNYVFYNEYEKFIEKGIMVPLLILAITWPFIYFMPNHVIGWSMLTVIPLEYYQVLVVYLKMKYDKSLEILDESFPYTLNYTMLIFNLNQLNILFIVLSVFVVLATNSWYSIGVLIFCILKFHLSLFIDKICALFGWNILEQNNLRRLNEIIRLTFPIYLVIILWGLVLYPVHLFLY